MRKRTYTPPRTSIPQAPATSLRIPPPECPGGEIGRRKGLKHLSTRLGNGRREWGQIRGNSPTAHRGACNPELSPGERLLQLVAARAPGKCRDLTAPA